MQIRDLVPAFRPMPVPTGLREPPRLSGGVPVLGHTLEFVQGTVEMLFRAYAEHGEICQFQVAHKRMYAMFGADAHQAFYRAPDSVLSPSEAYKMMVPVFGKDIVYDAPPERMTEQLKMLLPALRDRRMRTYGGIIVDEVEQSVAGWGDEGELDFVDYCRVLTNFTSSHCLLGREFREEMTDEFARVYHDLERGVTPAAYISPHLPLPSFRKRDLARARLVEMISEIIEARRHAGREGEDFLQTLMDSKYQSGAPLTEHEITGMLLASMFAGHHTSSVTTAWTMLELLTHPRYLDTLIAQLDDVYGDEVDTSYESLRTLDRTEWAVKEALRLHPPLFMLMRGVMEDFEYGGYHIPKGSFIVVSPTVSNRIPEAFPHPHCFEPERMAPGREEDKAVPFAFTSFGGGRHKCLGNAFAILQVKTILAILLRKFEFELTTDPIDSDFHGLVIGPRQPCRIRYRRRRRTGARVAVPRAAEAEAPPPVAGPAKRMTVSVDRDLCQGHAACEGECPEVFRADGPGRTVRVLIDEPPPELHDKVRSAARYCPNQVISLHEE